MDSLEIIAACDLEVYRYDSRLNKLMLYIYLI